MTPEYLAFLFGGILLFLVGMAVGGYLAVTLTFRVFWEGVKRLEPLEALEVCRLLYKAGFIKTDINQALEKKMAEGEGV